MVPWDEILVNNLLFKQYPVLKNVKIDNKAILEWFKDSDFTNNSHEIFI